jgi:hypothetical protein
MKYLLVFLLTACSGISTPDMVYSHLNIDQPTLESFPHCRSYGCAKIDHSSLSNTEIKIIKNIFKTNSNKDIEKQNIKQSIAQFEKIIGEKMGTHEDVAGTYLKLGHMQHDCVDESTNTTTYLMLLNQMGVLKFHDVNALTSRPPILSGRLGPHRTAVITEKDTGQKFAVDSWFHDNGVEPEIVSLDIWRWGWHPDNHEN